MASLEHDEESGRYLARFRFSGREYKRSLKTEDRKEARALLGRIEYTVQLIERGELEIPKNADPATFIVTSGKKTGEEKAELKPLTLKRLFETYEEKLPAGSKEESTLKTERGHFKNLLRHLRGNSLAQALTVSEVQSYVEKRSRDKWRGRHIRPETIKLELTTLRLVWNWAVSHELLSGPSPVRGIKYAKADEKPSFMTMAEIERVIARGGLSESEETALWESLYLTRSEVSEVLDYVKAKARHSFIYPLFVLVAHTGARRSEILRLRVDDLDFESGTVVIREKKKSKSKATTYRRVAMTGLLKSVMTEWLKTHPGGLLAIAKAGTNGPEALTKNEAHNHFKRALAQSKWGRIRGFHVFRHSFASNLAAASVDQRVIDEFLGHTTEEMRKRYRHLFPDIRVKELQAASQTAGGGSSGNVVTGGKPGTGVAGHGLTGGTGTAGIGSNTASKPKSFHGSVQINPSTAKMRLVQVADEIVSILTGDPNASLNITVEINAEFPSGASDQIKRAVNENATSLGFKIKDWE